MVGTPGTTIDPEDFSNMIVETIEFDPAESAASRVILFNHAYSIYVDSAGAGGNNTRFWLDGPSGGEAVIGPRASGDNFGSIRLRTSATTASAATCNIDTNGVIRRSTSSLKYKQDVQPHEFDLDAVRGLRIVDFLARNEVAAHEQWQRDLAAGADPTPEPAVRRYVGVIAEEVHAAGLTEFVAYHDETGEPDGVMYDRIALAALQLIEKLTGRVDELERRLAAREGE